MRKDAAMPIPTIDATSWQALEPEVSALLATDLAGADIPAWLERWSALECAVWEARAWPKRDRARNLADPDAQAAYSRFVQEVFNPWLAAGEELAARLLAAVAGGD
jgi:oligoendopeptidase F